MKEAMIRGVALLTHKGNLAAALFLPPEAARKANIRRGVAYSCDQETYAKGRSIWTLPPRSQNRSRH